MTCDIITNIWTESNSAKKLEIAEELLRRADELRDMATVLVKQEMRSSGQEDLYLEYDSPKSDSTSNIDSMMSRYAQNCYNARRVRDQIFADSSLFGEPGWDILLDMMISEYRSKKLSVSSVCIGSNVPMTTALRWLSILEERGLIFRESDSSDGRRSFVRLTAEGFKKMQMTLRRQMTLFSPMGGKMEIQHDRAI